MWPLYGHMERKLAQGDSFIAMELQDQHCQDLPALRGPPALSGPEGNLMSFKLNASINLPAQRGPHPLSGLDIDLKPFKLKAFKLL